MFTYLLECEGGKFGQNCSSVCGHCPDKKQCNNINGTCPNGCDSGYQGSHCTKGNTNVIAIHIQRNNL